jgi:signal transduction histidine kinase
VRFRARILLALVVVAIGPLIGITVGVRREMARRLTAQYRARATALAAMTGEQIAQQSATIANRLASLCETMVDDNRLRLAAQGGGGAGSSERTYVLDFAGQAMRLTGLSTLQIQDDQGRVVSSGHFRNEFAPGGVALVDARTPTGPLRVIARVDSVRLAGRRFTVVGGIAIDARFLRALAPDSDFTIALDVDLTSDTGGVAMAAAAAQSQRVQRTAGESASTGRAADGVASQSDRVVVAVLPFPFIAPAPGAGQRSLRRARFVITYSTAELAALTHSVDAWFAGTIVIAIVASLVGAGWLAAQVSRPLSRLAEQTVRVDLDRLDVAFASDRADEVGDLSRLLDAMTRRLRASAARVRDAEHRATVGDLARQVTHDVKNGLVPIRHVLRHLEQVEREDPAHLGILFAERRPTLDASVQYLDALARNYARLSRPIVRQPCDLNVVARDAAARASTDDRVSVRLRLDPRTPIVSTDALVLHRIIDNLVANAIDAVVTTGGTVTIGTDRIDATGARIVITDTGPGMTEDELASAFGDFHTTKPNGTGLGLSIVRRLTSDLAAALRVETAPGRGTVVEVEFTGGDQRPLVASS